MLQATVATEEVTAEATEVAEAAATIPRPATTATSTTERGSGSSRRKDTTV